MTDARMSRTQLAPIKGLAQAPQGLQQGSRAIPVSRVLKNPRSKSASSEMCDDYDSFHMFSGCFFFGLAIYTKSAEKAKSGCFTSDTTKKGRPSDISDLRLSSSSALGRKILARPVRARRFGHGLTLN